MLGSASRLIVLLLLTGCHAKLKREAPNMDDVRTQAFTTSGPVVQLGAIHDDSLVAAVVNTMQTVKAIEVARRIEDAVDIHGVNYALQEGIADGLQEGPPFAYTDAAAADGTLQLEILAWGLRVPYLGAPGEFTYDVRVRLYSADGKRIYGQRTRCETAAGAPPEISMALGTVNNVKQLQEMSDEEIQAAFEKVAVWCGLEIVRKLRKHAG